MNTTDWSSRTFRWDDWTIPDLLDAKVRTGLTVSLVVPARNEAATVGDVVERVRQRLVHTVALVDEIVVIDSDSDDLTASVAEGAGAVVHRSRDIRPDLGTRPGKGEAMWKSLFVTSGDILVFMDADLLDWDTHFVLGLLGPLLTDPVIELVKGLYERSFSSREAVTAYEGGRVTELVTRPTIALLFPELAGVVQPLAGEWAIRRTSFSRLSVPTGYAVEIAALVDVARTRGVATIAQVDLGRRAHRHQSLHDLGAMATQVLSALLTRAGFAPEPQVKLRQYVREDLTMTARDRDVPTDERPPAEGLM
ncbi:MAG: glycosyl transferase, family 2 [Marmoricola sp.]|nr:glycosyl transferase, family 2 [Marmoricola sp.]